MSVIVYAGASGGMATSNVMRDSITPLKTRFANLSAVSLANQMARTELADILERLTGCVEGKENLEKKSIISENFRKHFEQRSKQNQKNLKNKNSKKKNANKTKKLKNINQKILKNKNRKK